MTDVVRVTAITKSLDCGWKTHLAVPTADGWRAICDSRLTRVRLRPLGSNECTDDTRLGDITCYRCCYCKYSYTGWQHESAEAP